MMNEKKCLIKDIYNMLIENFIKFVLSERSKYEDKTGETFNDALRKKLLSFATKDHPVKYAFTMTDVERVGIYIKTSFQTPAGVYFYPLTEEYCKRLIENSLPFASTRKFVGIVKLRNFDNSGKWLKFINKGANSVSDSAVDKAVDLMNNKSSKKIDLEKEARHFSFNNDAKVFDAGYLFSQNKSDDKTKSTTAWAAFLRNLGYIGIYDSGNSVVHPSEPTQIVCLTPEAYEIVDIFETSEIRKKRDITHNKKNEMESWLGDLPANQRERLASSSKTSAKVLARLAILHDKDEYMLEYIAVNPNTHPSVLKHLVRSRNIRIICKIFQNKNMTNEILDEMGEDTVRNCINKLTSPTYMSTETITLLINRDEGRDNKVMRANVAMRTSDQKLLDRLSKDEDAFVRHQVAKNEDTPLSALKHLVNDESKLVRQSIAKSKNVSPEILSYLAKDENQDVRYFVASNKKTPKDVLAELANDDIVSVVDALIWNQSTDMSVLHDLLKHKSSDIRRMAKSQITEWENQESVKNEK